MKQTVVIDNGTGYTKMGYAGGEVPLFTIPTVLAYRSGLGGAIADDFVIGSDALSVSARTHAISYPVRNGQIQSWDIIERYWEKCFFEYLRSDTEDAYVLLTEPPYNTPENRETTAEIMFETFDVSGIYIGVQAVFSLIAAWSGAGKGRLTGTVVDSGDGVTHVVPVVDGYVVESAIQSVPVAGREATLFVQQLLRERGVDAPLELARSVKEHETYVCGSVLDEFGKYESHREMFRTATVGGRTLELGYEQFMAAEAVLNPEIRQKTPMLSLAEVVDQAVQKCPIDTRRVLYGNIVLSGGTTMFRGFRERLEKEVDKIVQGRLSSTAEIDPVEVRIAPSANQKHGVWSGASLFGSMDVFPSYCTTREEYKEHGAGVCRQSKVFMDRF
ncbi:MAG: actin-related protein 3 [Amphiamblys sp. WSBS2006]|nr:MAG: actin-related protein 3 [Amphiamblys sp. WSBS2006]